jgi:hypothetical protein
LAKTFDASINQTTQADEAHRKEHKMIHDATVEVTCDGCGDSRSIQPDFVYRNTSETSGYYDTSDEAIEAKLEQEDWIVRDGKHYCSESCVR